MLEFRLLGTLEVDGAAVPLGRGKERALLACLLLRRNEALSRDALMDALWPDGPPASADHALDVYASRLRKVFGEEKIIERRGGSLTLNVPDHALDLAAFGRLIDAARTAVNPGERLVLIDRALGLWRGDPLADLREEPFARHAAERLEEERRAALEDRFDALLALGRHADAIAELQAFVTEQPLRERARKQLMLALYRAGRQSDALDEYRRMRIALREELGLEPSRDLRDLEAAILRQDGAIDAPRVRQSRVRASTRPQVRRWRLFLGCAALAVAGAVTGTVLLLDAGGERSLDRVDFKGIAAIDPSSGRIVSEVVPTVAPGRLVADGATVWSTNQADDTVSSIATSPRTAVDTVAVGSSPAGTAFGGGALWVANLLDGTISRVDAATKRVVDTIRVGNAPTAVAYGAGSVWVTNAGARTVTRIDPRTGRVTATYKADADGQAVAFGSGSVWDVDESSDSVVDLDARSGSIVRTVRVGSGPAAIGFAFGSVWVANSFDGTVSRIDPRRGVVTATVDVGGSPSSLAATAHRLWVADASARQLLVVDPGTNTLAGRVAVGSQPVSIAATPTRLWLAVAANPAVHRGGTLRLVSPLGSVDSVDPALAYATGIWSVLTLTNDGLVGFRRRSGSDGTQIVPDIARAVPPATDGGTTYTFELRHGLRYSNGAHVVPADVRFVLERDFKLHSPGARFYAGIIGGAACAEAPPRCNLSRGVVADDAAGTVTFHLTAADPEFLDKLAMPFAYLLPAATTPLRAQTTPLPATGPYTFARYVSRRRAVLERNRRFRVWSQAAQPAGYPDRIVWDASTPLDAASRALESGHADVMSLFGPSPDLLHELRTQYASQVHIHPLAAVEYVFMNTRRPPFDDLRVRRALNDALDRNEVVRLQGGDQAAESTCQVLPPLILGYRSYCPYRHNLARARALVAASGTRGMRIRLWSYRLEPYATEMRYVASVLGELGYPVTLVYPGDAVYYAKIFDSRTRPQAGLFSWVADYPAPGNFFAQLSCAALATNPSRYCDERAEQLMARATHAEETDPEAAARAWSAVDRRVVDTAPVAPLFVNHAIDLVSKRVGNYEFSPQWGVLLDQLWVR